MALTVLPMQARRKKQATKQVVQEQLAPAEARRLSYFYQEGVKKKLA